MNESGRYLRDLRRALPRGQRRKVVAEIRSHLRDGIAAEIAGGLDRAEAERVVLERLGPPERLAAQFPATEDRPMKKPWIAALAVAAVIVVVAALFGVTRTDHTRPAATVTRSSTLLAAPVVHNGQVRMFVAPAGQKAAVAQLQVALRQVVVAQRTYVTKSR